MVPNAILRLALACAALAIGGCQGGRTVTLTVMQPGTLQSATTPVTAAHVRAVALDTNDVPLPVSLEALAELDRPLVSGVTDGQGRARLTLRSEGVYLIEINGPPFGPLAEAGPWRWTLGADGRSMTPLGAAPREILISAGP